MKTNSKLLLYLLIEFFSIINCYEKFYDDYSVIRVMPQTENQLKFMLNWAQNVTDKQLLDIDFWRFPSHINQNVDLMVAPNLKPEIIQLLQSKTLNPEVMIENVENRIRQETYYSELIERQIKVNVPENWNNWGDWDINNLAVDHKNWNNLITNNDRNTESDFFNNYESMEKINSFLENLKQKDPKNIFTQSIGRSTEGRELKLLKIGDSSNKPIVWIDGGTHAREWLGITTALYISYQLADAQHKCFVQKSDDCPQDVKELLNLYDWQILAVLNPDGYVFSRNSNRLWRKTRSKQQLNNLDEQCFGVDLNRNYDFQFGGPGSSSSACSYVYHGLKAFSEPETKNQAQHLQSFTLNGISRIKFFLSLHTYSQMILLPWGHTREIPSEYLDLENIAKEGYRALFAIEGTQYKIGSTSTILYYASGFASDWAFAKCGIKYSYTFELRDKGQHGFIIPQSNIIPTGNETFAAVKAMTKLIHREIENY